MLREFVDWVLENLGYISKKEAVLRSIPREQQKRARTIARKLSSLKAVSNVNEYLDLSMELTGILKESVGSNKSLNKRRKEALSLISMPDLYGFKPAMSRIYGLFAQNPFGAYAFIARHHPAVRACIQVILDEITNDGYVLIAEKGVTRKRLKEVYRRTKISRHT